MIDYNKILKTIHKTDDISLVKDITNAVNENQIRNKELLYDRLQTYLLMYENPKISIGAGWHGLLAHMLDDFKNVESFDIDPKCAELRLFSNVKYKTIDLNNHNPRHHNILVCCSCEHMTDEEIKNWVKKKKEETVVILQSNDYFGIEDHINCKENINHFVSSVTTAKNRVINTFEDKFDNYTRFSIVFL